MVASRPQCQGSSINGPASRGSPLTPLPARAAEVCQKLQKEFLTTPTTLYMGKVFQRAGVDVIGARGARPCCGLGERNALLRRAAKDHAAQPSITNRQCPKPAFCW